MQDRFKLLHRVAGGDLAAAKLARVEEAGLEWIKPRDTMNVFWEKWLTEMTQQEERQLLRNVVFEHPSRVHPFIIWIRGR